MKNRLLEKDIKMLLIKHLLQKSIMEKDDTLVNEFTIDSHTRRIDLLVVKKNSTLGFEIKSEADSLQRVDGQIDKYKNYLDKVIVVAAEKHIPNLINSLDPNIGLWAISDRSFKIIRKGVTKRVSHKPNILKLMPVNYLFQIAIASNVLQSSKTKNRKFLESALSTLSVDKLRIGLISYLKNKYFNYSSEFMRELVIKNDYDTRILSLLSPYAEQRLLTKTKNEKAMLSLKKLTDEYYFGKLSNQPTINNHYSSTHNSSISSCSSGLS